MNLGRWENDTLQTLKKYIGSQTIFLDIGAWIGPITLFAASIARKVISIEADPVAVSWLRQNLALNPELATRVTVIDKVLHPVSGVIPFGTRSSVGGDSESSVICPHMRTVWHIPTITPSELCEWIEDAPVSVFAKMDIEGGEYDILPNCEALLARLDGLHLSLHPHAILAVQQKSPPATINVINKWRKLKKLNSKIFYTLRHFQVYRLRNKAKETRVILPCPIRNFARKKGYILPLIYPMKRTNWTWLFLKEEIFNSTQ